MDTDDKLTLIYHVDIWIVDKAAALPVLDFYIHSEYFLAAECKRLFLREFKRKRQKLKTLILLFIARLPHFMASLAG